MLVLSHIVPESRIERINYFDNDRDDDRDDELPSFLWMANEARIYIDNV